MHDYQHVFYVCSLRVPVDIHIKCLRKYEATRLHHQGDQLVAR